jgi:hypothetical protein
MGEKKEVNISTFNSLDNPSLTLGMIIICMGACGEMSLNARTCSRTIE